ncbi:CAP domain-containing protein [Syncephalis fuscata]|nr:CAP domain-containing protein [Syncephalis fuscata]
MKFISTVLVAGAALACLFESVAAYDRDLMVCLVNTERQQRGLPALGRNGALDNAAQRHSNDQASRCVMSHTGSDGTSPSDRITASGYEWQGLAENVAFGWPNEGVCMKEWMNSPGHRANILTAKFKQFGSAVAYSPNGNVPYYTQTFGCNGETGPFPVCPGRGAYANAEVNVDANAQVRAPGPAPAPRTYIPAPPQYIPAPPQYIPAPPQYIPVH